MASKASKKKAAAQRRARANRAPRDVRTESELHSTALATTYGDGIAATAKVAPQKARAAAPAKARAASAQPTRLHAAWLRKARRTLDILSTAGGVLLREPKPAKRH